MKYDISKVSIVIPAKDEGEGLAKIIKSVKPFAGEIIVVDGHSKDNTPKICKSLGIKRILDHGIGRGDGVRLGLAVAKGEIIVLFDADGSHNEKDIPNFVMPILSKGADIVIGSRRTGGSFDLNMNFDGILRSGGADFLAYLVNKKFNLRLSDVLYSFRSIRRSIVPKLQLAANGFEIEQEMVVKSLKHGFKLQEIPSRENARAWGRAKLNTLTGVKLAAHLLKELYLRH